MKKTICLLMAIAMLVCCIPMGAFAAGEGYYTVAGTEALCGSGWNPEDSNNQMTWNETTGLYEKTFESVPAGTHQFKVTDGSWSNSWGKDGGSGNFEFTTTEVKNIKITFKDDDTHAITVEEITIEPYYVAGTDALCGVGWNPGYEANKMALNAAGLYYKTFKNVPAGDHEFKVTNGTWDKSWGDNGGNYKLTTTEAHNITIFFNAETTEITYELSEATPEDDVPTEPVEYDIELKVHYYREDGNYSGWEVHMWNGVESLSSTRAFELGDVEYNGTVYGATATYYADASDTWVGFIIKTPAWTKDPDGDRHIDISDVTGGTVHVYAKSGSALEDFVTDKTEAELGAKVTAAVYDYKTSTITVTTSYPIENPTVDTFTLEGPDGQMTISAIEVIDEHNYKLTYEGTIDEMNVYTLYFGEVPCVVTIPNTYSTPEFEAEYTYEGDDLGANWTADGTTFRLWAPTAAKVVVNLYDAGNGGSKTASHEMTQDVNGTWIVTVDGDLNGVYYTYSVTRKGETVEAVDPYARTTGVNGNRGMVINLDSTDPAGWADDDYVTQSSYTDAVIWELHVRDFSIDETSGMVNKGKYLAFTENGTTVPGTDISTGVDYMVDLGVNYVHLLPVYDINSVDETTGGYNWGYDPKNYNVPEGSYSTDPYNGAVRVTEFKQMVQALHEAGIGVIMDVVYNHVADAGQFCFNQIVPGYFSRVHDDGSYQSNSGCGNDTASERSMVSKYIVDSVLYWCEEYHIDGFRWDLVGLIDYETINAVMEAVHEVNPDIIFYGEGWEMCSWTTKDEGVYASDPYSKKMTIQNNDQMVYGPAGVFSFFNDTIRNVIHGGVFTATDKGFVAGNMNAATKQTVIDGYMANSVWGSANERVDTPWQTINYASCHDNYTLFDNLTVDAMDMTGKSAAEVAGMAAEMNKLAAAYYITAQGVPFIHAGEEMLRSKPDASMENGFNHNSYSAGDAINSFKWGDLQNELNADAYAYYKGLIALRKAYPALSMDVAIEIRESMSVIETGNDKVVAILNNGGSVDENRIISIFNADSVANTVTLPEGQWNVCVNKDKAGTEVLATVSGTVEVEATSAMILVKVQTPVCLHENTEVIPAVEATCIAGGLTEGLRCADCGLVLVEQQPTPIAEHSYDSVVTAPTCTEEGYTTHECAVCGDVYTSDVIPALGHSYENGLCVRCDAIQAPEKPYKIVNVVNGVHVYWNAVDGAEKYGVWRSETGRDGSYKWLGNPAATHFTDTTAESGKTYFYRITTMIGGKHSDKSDARGIAFVGTPDIKSRANTAAGVALSWDRVEGATGYAIYRKSYDGTDAWVRVGTIAGNDTFTWTDTTVKNQNGVAYKYTIRALAGSDMKTLSGCRTAGRTMVRLSSQVLTSAVKASATSVKCKWTTSSKVDGYQVRFCVDGEVVKTFTVSSYKTGVKTFTGLEAGQTYTVEVRTYKNVSGVGTFYSDWSAAKNVGL